MANVVQINRAPVLTLWASVVAGRQGFDADEALTLGKAMAGLTAQTKGRMIGIFKARKGRHGEPPKKTGLGEEFWVELCSRAVPAKNTEDGVRAVVKDKAIDPEKVRAYLAGKFGDDLDAVREAMEALAGRFDPDELAESAYALYEQFRPEIERGQRGWGQKGALDLDFIRSLGDKA